MPEPYVILGLMGGFQMKDSQGEVCVCVLGF